MWPDNKWDLILAYCGFFYGRFVPTALYFSGARVSIDQIVGTNRLHGPHHYLVGTALVQRLD